MLRQYHIWYGDPGQFWERHNDGPFDLGTGRSEAVRLVSIAALNGLRTQAELWSAGGGGERPRLAVLADRRWRIRCERPEAGTQWPKPWEREGVRSLFP